MDDYTLRPDSLTNNVTVVQCTPPRKQANRVCMSQSEEPKPPARKQTPRVPASVLYDRVVPIVLVIAALILLVVLAVVILGVGQPY